MPFILICPIKQTQMIIGGGGGGVTLIHGKTLMP